MDTKYMSFCDTKIGKLTIVENGKGITIISFALPDFYNTYIMEETPLIKKAKQEIHEYLDRKRTEFTLPLDPEGTNFQKQVWMILCQIPYGETRTYLQVATLSGKPSAARSIGMATNRNPILIVIPCHRVIGSNGTLVGYSGGLDIKQKLLNFEQKNN